MADVSQHLAPKRKYDLLATAEDNEEDRQLAMALAISATEFEGESSSCSTKLEAGEGLGLEGSSYKQQKVAADPNDVNRTVDIDHLSPASVDAGDDVETYTCPVCAVFSTDNLLKLNMHVDDCLSMPVLSGFAAHPIPHVPPKSDVSKPSVLTQWLSASTHPSKKSKPR